MKNVKNIKLFLMVSLIVSCTPNINNTLPSPKSSSLTNPNISQSLSTKPTDTPTITPSISISIPSSNPEIVKEIKVLSEDNEVIFRKELDKNYAWGENFYVMLPNQKKDFKAELTYNNGDIINYNNEIISPNPNFDFVKNNIKRIKWTSSSPIVANVDENGLINTYNLGETIITATFYENNRELKLTFKIKVLESLFTYYQSIDQNCNNITLARDIQKIGYQNEKMIGDTGITNGIKERAVFNGKVYDPNGVPVDGATVQARTVDCTNVRWVGESQITLGGNYVFRNSPINTELIITVTKDGWTSRSRNVILKDNLTGEPTANVFDFSMNYAIQDEPEIVSLKVNGKQALKSSKDDEFDISKNQPKNSKPTPLQMSKSEQIQGVGNIPELTSINSDKLEVEMTFSEPIKVDDIKNFFRLVSQSNFNNRLTNFTIDANYTGVEFIASADEKTVTFKTNKALLSNKGGDEARYLIDFTQAFRDKTDKLAINRRYIRFSPTQMNDFAAFSVKNDESAPKLFGIAATNGINGANDKIELRYSEPLEVMNLASYPSGLADPLAPSSLSRQLWYRDANDVKINSAPIPNSIEDNNATIFGFLNGSDSDPNKFKATYMIGRILSSELVNTTTNTVKMSALGKLNRIPNKTPIKGNTSTNDLIRSSKIEGEKVILEFSPDAFNKDDIIVLTVSHRIAANYVDRNRTPSVNDELLVNSKGDDVIYFELTDPAGRVIDYGDSAGAPFGIDVTNSQRAAIVE